VLVRGGIDEKTGEALSARVVAERVSWCAGLVKGMAAGLVAAHWDAGSLRALASGRDALGRPLPPQAWMAVRRLGWPAAAPNGVRVNDRVTRMAQELAGRLLRSALWRDALATAVTATWPACPDERTPEEWDAVRAAVSGGECLPSAVIRARTRQVTRFLAAHGRLPAGVAKLEEPPRVPAVLALAACDKQAVIERHEAGPARALLRVQLPLRPDPRSHRDWAWVALPLSLPPTVPAAAVLHLPTLHARGGRVLAGTAFTHAVPRAQRTGHTIALGLDWGLNTLLSAGAVRLGPDGTIAALGAGAQYRANGVLAKAGRLRRQGEQLHGKLDQYEKLTAGREDHPLAGKTTVTRDEAPARRRAAVEPERRARPVRRPVGRRPGHRRPGDRDLRRGPEVDGGPRDGPRPQHPPVPNRQRQDRRADAAPGRRARHRRGHRPREEHLPALPPLPRPLGALQVTRPAGRSRLEVGQVPRLRLAGRPRPRRLAAHRRPRPCPPGQNRRRPPRRHHGRPRGRRRA
jgi:hypothetical protein